jgi:hypothetical protein
VRSDRVIRSFNRDPKDAAEKTVPRISVHVSNLDILTAEACKFGVFLAVRPQGSADGNRAARAPRRTILEKPADAYFQERPLGRG